METTKDRFIDQAIKNFYAGNKAEALSLIRAAARQATTENRDAKEDIFTQLGVDVISKFCANKKVSLQDRMAKLQEEVTELCLATHKLHKAEVNEDAASIAYHQAEYLKDDAELCALRASEREYLAAQTEWLAELGDVLAVVSSMAWAVSCNARLTDGGRFLELAAWITALKFQIRERHPEFLHDDK